jgi:hypothetical protein
VLYEDYTSDVDTACDHREYEAEDISRTAWVAPADLESIESGLAPHDSDAVGQVLVRPERTAGTGLRAIAMAVLDRDFECQILDPVFVAIELRERGRIDMRSK